MYILHIETSTRVCSVALSSDEILLEYVDLDEGMNHAAILAPSIKQLLSITNIRPGDLGAISVSSGPGSYTGLRVGCSTAKAMAYSLKIPLVSIPTLTALAWAAFVSHPEAEFALPMLDARRNEVYTSLFDREMNQSFPTSSFDLDLPTLQALMPVDRIVVSCGDGAMKLKGMNLEFSNLVIDSNLLSSARHLVGPAFNRLSLNQLSDPMHFVPFYLKPPNITHPKKLF
jgi:tRNA threonylcarbamoyladenosine biosynthesis protein TsaB